MEELADEIRPKTYADIRDVAKDDEGPIEFLNRLQHTEWFINTVNII